MFAFNENTWQEVLTEVMPEVRWDLLTSDVLVQMPLAPVCSPLILIVVLCAGDLFRNAETSGFLSPSEQSVQRIQLCALGRICCVIGFNGELVGWAWGEKRKQECFSDLTTAGEAALVILSLIMIFEIP